MEFNKLERYLKKLKEKFRNTTLMDHLGKEFLIIYVIICYNI